MGARADRLNRVVLSVLGLLLLVAGAGGLLAGSGLLGDRYADDRVLPAQTGSFVSDNAAWLWPLVCLAAVLLALLGLSWLRQQLRTDRVGDIDLTTDRRAGETHVSAAAVTDALVDAVEAAPGVESASARSIVVRGRHRLLLHVRLGDRTDIAAARAALGGGPLTDLQRALGDDAPEVVVELEPSTKTGGRVVA